MKRAHGIFLQYIMQLPKLEIILHTHEEDLIKSVHNRLSSRAADIQIKWHFLVNKTPDVINRTSRHKKSEPLQKELSVRVDRPIQITSAGVK